MGAESSATTVWQGDLAKGAGTTSPESGAFPDVDVTWASRTSRSAGKTSPEELLAAAHSACFCMGLSHELAQAGTPPDRLEAKIEKTQVRGSRQKLPNEPKPAPFVGNMRQISTAPNRP